MNLKRRHIMPKMILTLRMIYLYYCGFLHISRRVMIMSLKYFLFRSFIARHFEYIRKRIAFLNWNILMGIGWGICLKGVSVHLQHVSQLYDQTIMEIVELWGFLSENTMKGKWMLRHDSDMILRVLLSWKLGKAHDPCTQHVSQTTNEQ